MPNRYIGMLGRGDKRLWLISRGGPHHFSAKDPEHAAGGVSFSERSGACLSFLASVVRVPREQIGGQEEVAREKGRLAAIPKGRISHSRIFERRLHACCRVTGICYRR
jgi:hypothetical protein